MHPAGSDIRALPLGPAVPLSKCQGCGRDIVWAVTVAGPNGPGGKPMPLDPIESLAGNVAVTSVLGGRLTARVLSKDEGFDRPLEYAAMTHFASCPTRTRPDLPPEVLAWSEPNRPRRGRRR